MTRRPCVQFRRNGPEAHPPTYGSGYLSSWAVNRRHQRSRRRDNQEHRPPGAVRGEPATFRTCPPPQEGFGGWHESHCFDAEIRNLPVIAAQAALGFTPGSSSRVEYVTPGRPEATRGRPSTQYALHHRRPTGGVLRPVPAVVPGRRPAGDPTEQRQALCGPRAARGRGVAGGRGGAAGTHAGGAPSPSSGSGRRPAVR